jgi:DNA processing protein
MEAEPAHWLALNRLPAVASAELAALVEGSISARDILAARAGPRGSPDWRAVEADLAWLEFPGRNLITLATASYPALLRQIPDPPPVLFVDGDPAVLCTPQVAMVGSRRASPCGLETAHALSAALAGCGLTVTSGLALGVDAASHRGALAGGGLTVAVAANGLDRVYPRGHRRLARDVAERGALVSEFSPGTPPLSGHFPRRNRLISGLGLGVVVVEAARRSGSLITARLAGEQGREVFAVPGPIQSPLAHGCHHLIRQGAKLVEQVSDILEELPEGSWTVPGSATREAPDALPQDLDEAQQKVLRSLAHRVTSIDSVVERSGLTADTVCSILLALELRGLVVPVAGGAYCRVTKSPKIR